MTSTVMVALFLLGYVASAATFYVLLARLAPVREDMEQFPASESAEIIELFPSERRAAA